MQTDKAEAVTRGPSSFSPPAMLGNRHVQSIVAQVPWRRRRIIEAARELIDRSRELLLDCGDGIRLQGHLTESRQPQRGLVVLLHGWEGSADSSYILSAGSRLLNAGFSVFRLNFRDHGDTQALNAGLFHSCRIDEVVEAVGRIRAQTDSLFFALVGQSLGGNFALRVAARARTAGIAIDRVLAVCPVLKPASTMDALDTGFWVYRRYFLNRWRRSLEAKAAAFPGLYRFGDLGRFTSLTEMTAFFVENYTEYESLDQYLAGYAITGEALANLEVPSRIIFAGDDPVIPVQDLESVSMRGALDVTLLARGGHCGFVDQPLGPSWTDREVVADLNNQLQTTVGP